VYAADSSIDGAPAQIVLDLMKHGCLPRARTAGTQLRPNLCCNARYVAIVLVRSNTLSVRSNSLDSTDTDRSRPVALSRMQSHHFVIKQIYHERHLQFHSRDGTPKTRHHLPILHKALQPRSALLWLLGLLSQVPRQGEAVHAHAPSGSLDHHCSLQPGSPPVTPVKRHSVPLYRT